MGDTQKVVQKVEKKWGDEITHIAFRNYDDKGNMILDGIHHNDSCVISVDFEGWVTVKFSDSKYVDVLGQIK